MAKKVRDEYLTFIADDDSKMTMLMSNYVQKNCSYDLEVETYASGEQCLANMHLNPDVVVLDYYFDSNEQDVLNGLEVMKKIKASHPNTFVIILSGQDDMDVALDTLRAGAFDYIVKNNNAIQLTHMAHEKIMEIKTAQLEAEFYKKERKTLKRVLIFFIALLLIIIGIYYIVIPLVME